jgi:hypothetical protein
VVDLRAEAEQQAAQLAELFEQLRSVHQEIHMSFANTLGKTLGNTGAYAKHAVIASGIGSVNFVAAAREATVEQYRIKDSELAARRDELRSARTAALPVPARQRRKIAA